MYQFHNKLIESDQKLYEISKIVELPLLNEGNVYHNLLESIVSQQLSVKVADVIWGRFINLFDNQTIDSDKINNMDIETMRSVGLSYQKSNYIKNVALFFEENKLIDHNWDNYSDEEIIHQLTKIKGVGVWTVQMILIFTLNRPDVLPVLDLGIQQGMKKLYNLESTGKDLHKDMEKIAENWKPYRSHASRLIWKWKDTVK